MSNETSPGYVPKALLLKDEERSRGIDCLVVSDVIILVSGVWTSWNCS